MALGPVALAASLLCSANASEVWIAAPSCVTPGAVIEVGIVVDPSGASVVGLQALLQYDPSALQLLSFEDGDSPYVVPIWSSVDPVAATIDLAVGFDPAMGQAQSPVAVAKRFMFQVLSSSRCATSGLIGFRDDPPFKTMLTTFGGVRVDPTLVPLGPLTVSAPPEIAQPADLVMTPSLKMDCVVPGILPPAATAACGDAPTVTFVRSDGATELTAPFCRLNSPVTITWTAMDDCGRSVSVTQLVTVPGIPGDFNSDGAVDARDLAVVLSAWGSSTGDGDINGDLIVDGKDLAAVLSHWTDTIP
jgi:hypothetical protein